MIHLTVNRIGLSSTCNFVDMSSTRENHADVDIKNISRHILTCYSKYLKYLRNNKIMSSFSRDTTIVAFCRPSFILWSQYVLYFRVCSKSRLFLCAMDINDQSFQSPHLEVGMVSLLYDSATEQRTIFVQNFKSYYMSTCRPHVRIFLPICQHEKKNLDNSPRKE